MPIAFSVDFPRIVAVEVTGSAKKPRLKRVEIGELAEPRNEDGTFVADKQGHLNAQVAAFIKDRKLDSGKQYLLVGPDAMRYRDLRLAFSDKRQINRVLPFQVEGLIPNIPIEDLALGYIPLVSEPGSSQLLVHAADRDYIRQRLIALEEAGCAIEAVDSHLSGTINLGLLHPELAADKPPTLWLDFAGTTAAVMIVDKGVVQTARVFVSPYLAGAVGAAAAADAKTAADSARREAEARAREIAAKNGLNTDSVKLPGADSASLPKGESVNMGAAQVADRIRHMSSDDKLKFVQRVAIEARRTLAISRLDAEPARLVVSGLGAEGPDLATLLGNDLRLEQTVAVDLMQALNTKDDQRLPDLGELTYLTGVALKGLGRDVTGIDFRTGNLAAGTLLDYARTPLAFTATLALLFGAILCLVSYTHVRRYKADIAHLRGDAEDGLRQFHAMAFRDVNKTKVVPKQEQTEREYYVNEEDPAAEINNNYDRLLRHQKRLQGATTDNFLRPQPADQILALVLRTLTEAKPSYDFVLLHIDIKNNNLNIDYFASLSETAEELAKVGNVREADRMYDALRKMTRGNPKFFADEPKQTFSSRAQVGPEERKADQVKIQIPLVKPERKAPAAKPATPGKGGA
ncbi:MAG: hypothetical protein HS108_01115 [Planctomycetes bacterium]|nr:hypothetical protein [Planctomycetota bacterium]MCL4729176.1 hypothetical protein [Planctomycetota bacterium]